MDKGQTIVQMRQPVGKETPFRLGAKWLLGGICTAMAVQWTFLQPFNFWHFVFVKDGAVGPWFYIVIMSIIIGVATVYYRLFKYYHYLYRFYRERVHVDNLYEDRTVIQGKYNKLIEKTNNTFFMIGISLHTFLGNKRRRNLIIRTAIERKVSFKFLLHDPECKFVKQKAIQENKQEDQISKDCTNHINELKDMAAIVKKETGMDLIKFRTIKDEMPDCFFCLRDDTLYIEPYLQTIIGRECPVISLKKNEINETVFETYVQAMEEKWLRAKPVE